MVRLLERIDAFRRPQRLQQVLEACACDYLGRLGWQDKPIEDPHLFEDVLEAARSVDAAGIARACHNPAEIAERLRAARTAAVNEFLCR